MHFELDTLSRAPRSIRFIDFSPFSVHALRIKNYSNLWISSWCEHPINEFSRDFTSCTLSFLQVACQTTKMRWIDSIQLYAGGGIRLKSYRDKVQIKFINKWYFESILIKQMGHAALPPTWSRAFPRRFQLRTQFILQDYVDLIYITRPSLTVRCNASRAAHRAYHDKISKLRFLSFSRIPRHYLEVASQAPNSTTRLLLMKMSELNTYVVVLSFC